MLSGADSTYLLKCAIVETLDGRYPEALAYLEQMFGQPINRGVPSNAKVSALFFASVALIRLGRGAEAIPLLEAVVASSQAFPDQLMREIEVSPAVQLNLRAAGPPAPVPDSAVPGFLLAEEYTKAGRREDAARLLSSVIATGGGPVCALKLASLYGQAEDWPSVIWATHGYSSGSDDAALAVALERAEALICLDLHDAALAVLDNVLKVPGRDQGLIAEGWLLVGRCQEQGARLSKTSDEYEGALRSDRRFQGPTPHTLERDA